MALAAIVGAFAWTGDPRMIPLALGFPLLWSQARSRRVAILVSATYFLSASRALPQGVANYYGTNGLLGFALWVGASLAFVLVHGVVWTPRRGWPRTLGLGVAMLALVIPPFGIVGWASPLTAAGVLFPGLGWIGLALCFALLLLLTTSRWPVVLAVIAVLWGGSVTNWTAARSPSGWIGIDTHFRGIDGQYAGYVQETKTIDLVRAAIARGHNKILLPESALGIWTPTVERLWRDSLKGTEAAVVAGAVTIDGTGYDNVMLELTAQKAEVLYHERIPVPFSMWQPWRAWMGQSGGARVDFFANPVVQSRRERVAVLICYEQLLVWPILQSILYRPRLILASSNGWWTMGTNIMATQRAIVTAWAKLFDIPIVFAVNG